VVAATPKDMRHETLAPGAVQVNLRAEPAQSANNGDDPVAPSPPDSTVAVERPPVFDIMLGATKPSPQYGILGEVAGRKVALDLNETQTISLFGVQGGGKSYTLGAIAEMATAAIPAINALPRPLATVIFHYSQTMDYEPEFTSMAAPNRDADQLHQLAERYGASPQQLTDILLLVPADKLDERRIEYPQLEVQPLKFASAELNPGHWRFLMGAVGNQALYLRQFNRVMRSLRNDLSLVAIRKGLAEASLPEHLRSLATDRLNLAAEYIDDSANLSALIRPGRLVIVDLRDEFIEKDEALGLFVVILQLIADATDGGKSFNKLVVFDEAHKYIESPDLVDGLVEVVREMRHKGTSILVASQDPPSVPVALIELSTQIILHKFNSPAWLKHIQKANSALGDLTADKMSALRAGEAYIWSSKATDDSFTRKAVKIRCRPRVTQHGGTTKTAV
jgi:DNA helicase HerA-like ATPase